MERVFRSKYPYANICSDGALFGRLTSLVLTSLGLSRYVTLYIRLISIFDLSGGI